MLCLTLFCPLTVRWCFRKKHEEICYFGSYFAILPRLCYEADIWPPLLCLTIKVATDASDFAWGGHTMSGQMEIAREYFSEWEARESSTYRELVGVCRCLQAMVHKCEGRFVVLQVDAMNLQGIVNRGSSKLGINELARDLF